MQNSHVPQRICSAPQRMQVLNQAIYRAPALSDTSTRGRPLLLGHSLSLTRTQFTSGRSCSQVTVAPVARSIRAQNAGSIGVLRAFQLLTTDCPTPMASASLPTPLQASIARSRGLVTPVFNHERDSRVNTAVLGGAQTISAVDSIASRLAAARKEKQWTQAQLAKAAGVSQGTVGNIESGGRQGLGSLPRLAEALGVRHKWLRDGDLPVRASDAWPFARVPLERYLNLSPQDQGYVEAKLEEAIEKCEPPPPPPTAADRKRAERTLIQDKPLPQKKKSA
jgi:transcriptional regulator with XRE-family HTH domain